MGTMPLLNLNITLVMRRHRPSDTMGLSDYVLRNFMLSFAVVILVFFLLFSRFKSLQLSPFCISRVVVLNFV